MNDPSLRRFEEGPYLQAIAEGITAVTAMERSMRGGSLLPADLAEVAVGAAIRRLVADGQLPALGTPRDPAPRHRIPDSHKRARPAILVPAQDSRLDAARRALGG